MSQEKGESHSDNFGPSEEWMSLVGEIAILPVEILGGLAGEAFEGFAGE